MAYDHTQRGLWYWLLFAVASGCFVGVLVAAARAAGALYLPGCRAADDRHRAQLHAVDGT